MRKNYLSFLLICLVVKFSFCQKINFAAGMLLDALPTVDCNYKFSEQNSLGIFYQFGNKTINNPVKSPLLPPTGTFFGAKFIHVFPHELSYFGLNAGIQYYRFEGYPDNIDFVNVLSQKRFGGSVFFGFQKWSINHRVSFFQEYHFGVMPSNLLFQILGGFATDTGQSPIITFKNYYYSWLNYKFGMRFYIGKQNF